MSEDPSLNISRLLGLGAASVFAGYSLYKLYTTYLAPLNTPTSCSPPGSDDGVADGTNDYTYMDPDTLSPEERKELLTQFQLAIDYMNSRHGKALSLSNDDRLKLYAYFKLAKVGPNTTPRPSLLDFERTAMWNAWSSLHGLSKTEAMICYIEKVHVLDPEWRDKVTSKALHQVLGENNVLTCDETKAESDDEDDVNFNTERAKSLDQVDAEREMRAKQQRMKLEEDKQKMLKQKLMSTSNVSYEGNQNDAEKQPGAASSAPNKDIGGPVFSSASKNQQDEDYVALAEQTIAINNNNNNNNNNNDDDNNNKNNDNTHDNLDITNNNNADNTNPTAPTTYNYIHIFPGEFRDLVRVDDIDFFEQILFKEQLKVIRQHHPEVDVAELLLAEDLSQVYNQIRDLFRKYQVTLIDSSGVNILHLVAEQGSVAQMMLLVLKYNHHINLPNSDGDTTVFLAIAAEKPEMVEFLLNNGAASQVRGRGDDVREIVEFCDNEQVKKTLTALLEPHF